MAVFSLAALLSVRLDELRADFDIDAVSFVLFPLHQ
jgi:hypothetical protein